MKRFRSQGWEIMSKKNEIFNLIKLSELIKQDFIENKKKFQGGIELAQV